MSGIPILYKGEIFSVNSWGPTASVPKPPRPLRVGDNIAIRRSTSLQPEFATILDFNWKMNGYYFGCEADSCYSQRMPNYIKTDRAQGTAVAIRYCKKDTRLDRGEWAWSPSIIYPKMVISLWKPFEKHLLSFECNRDSLRKALKARQILDRLVLQSSVLQLYGIKAKLHSWASADSLMIETIEVEKLLNLLRGRA